MAIEKIGSNNNYRTFSGEIYVISPLIWFGLLVGSIVVYMLGVLGVYSPVISLIEYLTIETKADVHDFNVRWENLRGSLSNIPSISEQNQDLIDEVATLKARLAEVDLVFSENEQLIRETGIEYARNYEVLGAQVIGYERAGGDSFSLNKGDVEGVKVGDVVVIENILIGKIINVRPHTSVARLITSTSSTIPVRTADVNLGILRGGGGNLLYVEQILQSQELATGIPIYTSGLDTEYPPNLFVGEVSAISADPRASTKQATLTLPARLNNLTRVKVLSLP